MRALVLTFIMLTGSPIGRAVWAEQEPINSGTALKAPPKEARKAFDAAAKAAKDRRTDDARRGYEKAVELCRLRGSLA